MTNYNDVFGNDTVPPSGMTYRAISLSADVTLNWPDNYEGTDFVASINDVTPTTTGLTITLPAANVVSTGRDILITNVGSDTFTVSDNSGNVLATIAAGVAKYLYIKTNSTAAGTWGVTTFGAGTSAADASALSGYGMKVIGATLNVAHPVSEQTGDQTVTAADRAKVLVTTGGTVTYSLPQSTVVGDNFFFGAHNAGTGSMILDPNGGELIDGQSTFSLVPGESAFIFNNGSTWYTVGYGRSTQFQFTKLVKDVSAGGTFTLTSAEAANKLLQFTGAPISNVTIVVPTIVAIYYMQNAYTGSATLEVRTAAGTGVSFNNTDRVIIYCDGVNVVSAQSATVGTNLSIVNGTAANPAINFSSDTDTGFYRVTTNTVGIAANGVQAAAFSDTAASVAGSFSCVGLTSTGAVALSPANLNVVLSPTGTGVVTINPATAGSMNNVVIGGSTPAAGNFTTGSFTGAVTGVTASVDDNTTKFATTGYVIGQGYLKSATASLTYQPLDADLTAIAGLSSATDKLPYATGAQAWALADFTAGGRALVNSAGTANTFPYFSSSNTVTLGSITSAARSVLDDTTTAAMLTTLGAVPVAGGALTGLLKFAAGASIAAAATVDLTGATGNTLHLTGNTGVTGVTMTAGQVMGLVVDGTPLFTHHSTNLNLPGGANIQGAAGDRMFLWYDGTTVYVLAYIRANGGVIRGLGVGQTFTDVSASRTAGVQYTNSTNYPIWVAISSYPNTTSAIYLSVNGSGNQQIRIDGVASGVATPLDAIVQPGDTYILTNSSGTLTIARWWELR